MAKDTVATRAPAPEALPGPADPLFLRQAGAGYHLLRDPLRYLPAVRRRYGPVSGLPARRPRIVFVLGAEEAREVLIDPAFAVDSFRHLRMPPGSPMRLLTSGLLGLNGPLHRRHRQAMRGAFSPRQVGRYAGTILRVTDEVLAGWPEKGAVDLHGELAALVTRASMATMAGLDTRQDAERLHGLMVRLGAAAGHPLTALLPVAVPGTPYRRMHALAGEAEQVLRGIVARRRAGGGADLLSKLIHPPEPDEGEERLSDDELIAEAYTILCQDSVASSLFWTLVLLDRHRPWWHAVRREVLAVAGPEPPTPEVVERMPVLDQVIKESQRLLPPAGFVVRFAGEGAAVGGFPVRPGAMTVVSSYVAHRDARAFPDPDLFLPERWTGEAAPGYFPFGFGPHSCIGRALALLEMKLVLTRIMQRCPVVLEPGARVDPVVRISLVPGRPVRARVLDAGTDEVPAPGPVAGELTRMVRISGEETS
ncbi:cytochrome P450 [Nonomuraea typhae]|uniref:cytochrome P450 n=1 Tax=Nonomuraea typhae TaxID=2603600 RepID=UPI0012F814BC|nr:cytochrome P450 [Nonomuraea typhae]